jgi:Asp-tRNA(Asn)/Glu-tRNA(Gln) amidotransferase A subunit family amidase
MRPTWTPPPPAPTSATHPGKTNLDQFACGLNGTRSPYGAVPNAFNPAYVSGGSSSGSAYVVATGLVDFALGTDTAGSGRVPAGMNNIVGLKPSKGLISTRGVLPAAQSVDCVSIFARTVAVAVKALQASMGVTTEVCVQTSMREANDRGYDNLLLVDCSESYFPEFKAATIAMTHAQGAIVGWTAPRALLLCALET